MPARLRIRLTEQEKEKLISIRNQGNIPRRSQQRIEILIRSDGGWTVQKIALDLKCSEKMVRRTIERWLYQEEKGLFDAKRKGRKGRKRRWNSEDIEYLENCIESEPRTYNSRQLSEKLDYVVAIRCNHGVWLSSNQRVRANKWCKFERTFSNQKSETRYIREIIYGKKRAITYWEITTDPETMPENCTSFVMTNLQGNLKKTLGNLYGLRTWVESGFRQCKQELGWTDYRLTNFQHIERWWEIIFCVYTMISLNSLALDCLNQSAQIEASLTESSAVNFFLSINNGIIKMDGKIL